MATVSAGNARAFKVVIFHYTLLALVLTGYIVIVNSEKDKLKVTRVSVEN